MGLGSLQAVFPRVLARGSGTFVSKAFSPERPPQLGPHADPPQTAKKRQGPFGSHDRLSTGLAAVLVISQSLRTFGAFSWFSDIPKLEHQHMRLWLSVQGSARVFGDKCSLAWMRTSDTALA